MREVEAKIRFKGDDSDAQKAIARLQKAMNRLNVPGQQQNFFKNAGFNEEFLRRQFAETQKIANQFEKVKQTIGSTFGKGAAFGGGFGLVDTVLGAVTSEMSAAASVAKDLAIEAIRLGANFESTENSLRVFAGSTAKARQELSLVDEIARQTTGLRLETAEQGYKQLRSLGFAAETARGFIKELAEEKVTSGASEDALQKIIFNFGQISSGAQKVSQELREILTQMPSLRRGFFDAFGSLDPRVIQSAFDQDTQGAIQKFIDTLAKGKTAQGGFNESVDKFSDAWIRAGREFSKPILPELTKDIRFLTGAVDKNGSVFKMWGENVADALREVRVGANQIARILAPVDAILKRIDARKSTPGRTDVMKKPIGQPLGLSREDIDRITQGTPFQTEFVTEAGFDKFQSVFDAQIQTATEKAEEWRQTVADIIFQMEQDAEKARQMELSRIADNYATRQSITENFYSVAEARLNQHLRYTSNDELNYQKKLSALRSMQIQRQISEAETYYKRQLQLNIGDKDATAKLQNEKIRTLGKLNAELKINEINSIRETAEIEKRIFDERRNALIEFKNLQIEQSRFGTDNRAFDLQRLISQGNISAQSGFDELITITRQSYQTISKLTIESYQEQLKNQSLTKEQRLNLTTQMFLEEQKLAEENRRRILEIEDDRYQTTITNLRRNFSEIREIWQSQSEVYGGLDTFFNSDNYSGRRSSAISQALGLDKFRTEKTKIESEIKSFMPSLLKVRAEYSRLVSVGASKDQDGYFTNISASLGILEGKFTKLNGALEKLNNKNPQSYFDLEAISKGMKAGVIGIEGFDQASKKLLEIKQRFESADLSAEIEMTQKLLKAANSKDGNPNDATTFSRQLEKLTNQQTTLGIRQQAEAINLYENSLDGLREAIANLRGGDVETVLGVRANAVKSILREQKGLLEENIYLQEQIARVGENAADRYKNAWLSATLEVKNANIEAMEEIIRANVRLDDANKIHTTQIRARVLQHLSEQRSMSETIADSIIGVYEKAGNAIDKLLDKNGIGKIPLIGDIAKGLGRNFLTNITRNLMDAFLPADIADQLKSSGNPVLDENRKQTDLLKQIRDGVTLKGVSGIGSGVGNGSTGGGSVGGLFGIIKNLIGGGGSSGFPYAMNQVGGFFNQANSSVVSGAAQLLGMTGGNGSTRPRIVGGVPITENLGNGGLLANLKNIFSTKDGGIFAPQKTVFGGQSKLAGIMGGVGSLVSLAGGLIGGRVGGILSSAGTGAQIGAMFGPWGAGIGAGIGALVGLFSGDPKRKADKAQLPQLQSGFADALAQLRQLLQDTKALRVEPESALSKAQELRQAIANSFGLTWQSKKYSKQVQSQIGTKLTEADSIIKQIRDAADMARAANDRNNRILPEFASGTFFSESFFSQLTDFKQRNGMLKGGIPGKDSIPVLAMEGELIANQRQQQKIRDLAGFDVFKYAGIPNYPKKMADGGLIGNSMPSLSPSPSPSAQTIVIETLVLQTDLSIGTQDASKMFVAGAETSTGQKVIVKSIVNEAKNNDLIKREILTKN